MSLTFRTDRGSARFCVVLVLLAAIAGDGAWWFHYRPVSIDRILARPDVYDGKTVTVAGTVESSTWLFDLGVLQVNDGTGTIWVSRRGPVPRQGEKVTVRGKVTTVLQVGPMAAVGIDAE